MSLDIIQVINKNNGNPDQEVVKLKADARNTNPSSYAIEDMTFNGNEISNLRRNFFTLPSISMNKDEILNVYTGKAPRIKRLTKIGEHDYYLGLDSCIWNNTGDSVKLFLISPIQNFLIKDVTE